MPQALRGRFAAVGLGLGLVVGAELVLRLSPLAPPSREDWNRQYGVISIEHYYAQNTVQIAETGSAAGVALCGPSPGLVRTGDSRRDAMQPAQWPCDKPADTFRVVMVGESSVQGYGLEPGQTLPDQLETLLQQGGRRVEVINAGVAGYNSLQIRRMLPELWRLSPDLVIYYGGHNEFTYYAVVEAALAARPSLRQAREWTEAFALTRLVRSGMVRVGALPPPPPVPEARRDPLALPSPAGPAAYNQPRLPEPATEAEHQALLAAQTKAAENIRALYATNVRQMVAEAREHGAAFVLVTPVCRLDGPIGRSIHWRWLGPEQRTFWDSQWPGLRDAHQVQSDRRLTDLLAIDDTYADLQQKAGLAALGAGQREEALAHFKAGLDHMAPTRSDRAPWSFGDDVLALGRELGVPTLDLRPDFERSVTAPPPGPEMLFLDVLHFSGQGTRLVAERLVPFLEAAALLPAAAPR